MSVPKSLKEAAQIDGCTSFQATVNIIIPLMRASFVQCLFLTITRCFMVYDVNLSLTKGEPFNSSVMAAMHVYNQAFTYKNYGTRTGRGTCTVCRLRDRRCDTGLHW